MLFVVATLAIPTQLGVIPMFILMKDLGWTATLGAVIVPTLVTAFGVFFMRQYLVDVIPDELIERASPSLTTVNQDEGGVGRTMAELLIRSIEGEDVPRHDDADAPDQPPLAVAAIKR